MDARHQARAVRGLKPAVSRHPELAGNTALALRPVPRLRDPLMADKVPHG